MPLHKDIIERANARLGSVLKGKWRLDEVIGIGGMASVYAATHRNQARAAIKLLHPEVALDAEVTARFLREGYVANAVGHPGTVTVLDDDVTEDNAPFLVMELLVGQTLDTMLALAPEGIAVHEVLPLLDQLLDVLAAAQDKGIVHRDLKPENLFLTSDGRLKVLDFGIARLRELSGLSPSATQAGTVLGTPAFMAPEQALGRWQEVDGRTDIWAVGATAFTLLTGHFVHEAESVQEQLVLSATRPARRVRELNPAVPEGLARVIDRALSFDRADRFPHARGMRGALRQATGLSSLEPLSPVSPRIPESARVASPADEHGVTLVAPLEITSAITGRAEAAITAQPVTRSTIVSGRSSPSRWWPLLAGLLGLGLLVATGLMIFGHRAGNVAPLPSTAVLPVPRAPEIPITASPLAVAPILNDPRPNPSASSPVPALKHVPPAVARPARIEHLALPALPSLPHAPSNKSLVGDDNPFDRRH